MPTSPRLAMQTTKTVGHSQYRFDPATFVRGANVRSAPPSALTHAGAAPTAGTTVTDLDIKAPEAPADEASRSPAAEVSAAPAGRVHDASAPPPYDADAHSAPATDASPIVTSEMPSKAAASSAEPAPMPQVDVPSPEKRKID